jgi:Peptidase A4 family
MGSIRANLSCRLPRTPGGRALPAVLAAVLAVASCSTPGGGTTAGGTASRGTATSPSPSSASASGSQASSAPGSPPATPAAPFPAIAPVVREAGWIPEVSQHWVGYTFPTQNVTGVRAEWIEPTVTGHAGAEEFVWIGIGGWDQTVSNIIQAGTFVYFPGGGQTNEGVWYQRIPLNQRAIFPLVEVGPGDRIYASVIHLSGAAWQMLVDDVNIGSTFRTVLRFHSLGAYPSFIVEDPNAGPVGPSGPFYPFPRWGSVTFTNLQVRVGRTWVAAASLSGIRVDMVQNGGVLATAGSLSRRSSFSAIQR